jgi:predicted amidohydrolase YtcJ
MKTMINTLGALALLLMLAAPAMAADVPSEEKLQTLSAQQPADTFYFGGDILTMEGKVPRYVEALAVKDGRITFAGAISDAGSWKGPDTRVVNLAGRTLLPGFAANHTDYNVTPIDQMFTVWTAVNRTTRSGRVLGPEQRITPYEALQ